jgi:hypothetical protein
MTADSSFYSSIIRGLIPAVVLLIFVLLRRLIPPRDADVEALDSPDASFPNPIVFGSLAVAIGAVLVLGLKAILTEANRLLAMRDANAELILYPSRALWWALPVFLAICASWEMALWLWTFFSPNQARTYRADTTMKAGFDSTLALRWMGLVIGGPGTIATILALPIHTTLTPTEIRDGHFATLRETIYPYSQATTLTEFEGYAARDGSFTRRAGILIRFHDGRTFNTADTDDPKSSVDPLLRELLIRKTGLQIQHVRIQP